MDTISQGEARFAALLDGEVVGWCDALRKPLPIHRHVGVGSHCERSEAIQGNTHCACSSWVASSPALLAMTSRNRRCDVRVKVAPRWPMLGKTLLVVIVAVLLAGGVAVTT